MIKHIGSRLIRAIPVIFIISFISFLLMYMAPGDPAAIFLAQNGDIPDPIAIATVQKQLGLDRPFFAQYVTWFGGIFTGNLGASIMTGKPVFDEIARVFPNTLKLTFLSLGLTLLISTPLGILSAKYEDSKFDQIVRAISFVFSSFPGFLAAILLILLFGVKLKWLPTMSTGSSIGIIMPMLALVLTISPTYIRQIRTAVLHEMNEGYVLTLRSRGIHEFQIFFNDILRNISPTILTLIGINFGYLLGGTSIIEIVCSYPGIGQLGIHAISTRDYPVVQAYTLLMGLIFVGVNIIVDVLQVALDPQRQSQKYSKKKEMKHIEHAQG